MKRFLVILLCIIISFCFIIPVNSYAFDVQGTEYPDPSLLPPDVNFSNYSYYFLTVHGTTDNPVYRLILVQGSNVTENCLRFLVSLDPSETRIYASSHSSHGVSTSYSDILVLTYNDSSGKWSGDTFSNYVYGFVFDDFSTFNSLSGSLSKYIIGSNCDIYDYSGILLRSGDYGNLCSYFKNGLSGSSDKSEKPTEPTTSGGSDTGGVVNIYLSSITDLLSTINNKFTSSVDSITSLVGAVDSLVGSIDSLVNGDSSSDGSIFLHLSVIKNTLVGFMNSSNTKLDEIKQEILNFERYFSEFSAVNGEIANIFSVLSGLNSNIVNIHTRLMEIKEIFNGIGGNVSDIYSDLHSLLVRVPSNFDDIILTIKDNSNSIYSDLHSLLVRIPSNFDDIILNINSNSNSIYSDLHSLLVRIPSNFDDIILTIKNNSNSIYSDLHSLLVRIPSNFDNIISTIKDNSNSIYSDLHSLLVRIPSNFDNIISTIKNNSNSIYSDLHSLLLRIPVNFGDSIKSDFDDLISHIQVSFDSLFDDISLKIGSLTDSELINAIKAVETAVNNLPESIEELLKYLFIPTTEKPQELMNLVSEHFEFVHQLAEIGDVVFNPDNFDNKAPEYIIEFDSDLFRHFKGKIVDFSIIPYDYIVWFKMLVSGITCYFFLQKVRKRLPTIINGGATP